jgi:hypothetical protein
MWERFSESSLYSTTLPEPLRLPLGQKALCFHWIERLSTLLSSKGQSKGERDSRNSLTKLRFLTLWIIMKRERYLMFSLHRALRKERPLFKREKMQISFT